MPRNLAPRRRVRPHIEQPLRFSFMHLDTTHPAFDLRAREGDYLRRLLARLKDLSRLRVKEFYSTRSAALRIQPINFRDPGVAMKSFGIPGMGEADEAAFQFAISANEHGRVHGFLLEDTFYVRWLDPDHNLYPGAG